MSEDLINCYKDCEKLIPLLHLPIQSGSNKILKSMNRKHNREYYMSVIEKLNKVNKNTKISSDFIVGYPEETEKDFRDTIEPVKEIGFINSYSFIFSPRPGTPAATKKLNNLEIKELETNFLNQSSLMQEAHQMLQDWENNKISVKKLWKKIKMKLKLFWKLRWFIQNQQF